MTISLLRLLTTAALLSGASLVAAELPILTKARARLGTDAALDAIRSIHFVGTHESTNDDKPMTVPIEIFVKKPYFQRITVSYPKYVETTALNNLEGWVRRENLQDGRVGVNIVDVGQLKALRANTWENLSYFRGLEDKGGKIEDLGPVTQDGIACEKIVFRHDANISFVRYFDLATGRLVYTETGAGGSTREEGEILVNGVRFPKKVVLSTKTSSGKDQIITVTFEKVTVNENIDDRIFAVPPTPHPALAPIGAKPALPTAPVVPAFPEKK